MKKRAFRIRGLLSCLALLLLAQCDVNRSEISTEPESRSRNSTASAPTGFAPASSLTLSQSASGSDVVLVGAGDIGRCGRDNDEATAALLDYIPGTVFALGDNAYSAGSAADYANCYHPTWGRHKDRTRPAPGDKDYKTAGASGYFNYFGAAAGDPSEGYYSYDLGNWHVVVLNSNSDRSAGSPQEQWLRADLAATTKPCTLAYWHHPLFWSDGYRESIKPFWDALYEAGAEVVLNAHQRNYERFAPQTPDEDRDDQYGIRQFIIGTGGYSASSSFGAARANSEVRERGSFGVLKLSLHDDGYSWEFVPIAGASFTDAGSGSCHGAPGGAPPGPNQPPTAHAGGPYVGSEGSAVQFNGSASSDPDGDALTYAWAFGDGTTGSGATPSHTYRDNGSYTATLTVTDSKGAASGPATSSATIGNVAPSVDAGPDATIGAGQTFDLSATFSDAGADDAAWSYSIDWGDGSAPQNGSKNSQSDPITGSHTYGAVGSYTVQVTVTDKDGGQGSDALTVTVTSTPPPPPPPGSGAVVLVGAGDIGVCDSDRDEKTAQLLDAIPGTVFTIGDNANPDGTAAEYSSCYGPTWGRHKDRTYAAIGDNDMNTGSAAATWDYFGDRAGPRDKGYYSFDLGEWHIVVLNSNCSSVGGCGTGSPQDQWLVADLAASTKTCTLAIWHEPRFWSGGNETGNGYKRFWRVLYDAGAELVLNGHRHLYERYAPQDKDGVRDPSRGIRQITVGTGGSDLVTPGPALANSEIRDTRTHGVLKLALSGGSYSWEFVPVAGQTFTDSGSGTCH